jgi:UDP-galactose transporter B1
MGSYLILLPYFPPSLLSLLSIPPSATGELSGAMSFLTRYPQVFKDVLAFAACGAVGQIFIYLTLSKFSSILLVTVTVTRKMFTMILSVMWFGHRLTQGQWLGVGLVFAGIGVEGLINRQEKIAKDKAKAMKLANGEKKEL